MIEHTESLDNLKKQQKRNMDLQQSNIMKRQFLQQSILRLQLFIKHTLRGQNKKKKPNY